MSTKDNLRQSSARCRGFIAIAAVILALASIRMLQGPRTVPLQTFADIVGGLGAHGFDRQVILTLRLPRLIAVMVAGAALGSAGFLMQTAMRNRLAEPHILGLNAGASLTVVLLTTYPPVSMPEALKPFSASLGAGLLFGLVLLLSTAGGRRYDPARLIFFGIALSALASALVTAILILNEDTLEQLRFWLIGDSAGVSYTEIAASVPAAVLGLLAGCVIMPALAVFNLGDKLATALGASVRRVRLAALAVTALLCGSAVSLVGPIGFVGLMAPAFWPAAYSRPSVGALVLCALSGCALLLTADILAVGLLPPTELPTGALTGLAGAPFFIWLVSRKLP